MNRTEMDLTEIFIVIGVTISVVTGFATPLAAYIALM